MPVKIRYKGSAVVGRRIMHPCITTGGHKIWASKHFAEQEPDGTYTKPMEFYLKHKDILDNKKKFEVEVIGEEGYHEEPTGVTTEAIPAPVFTGVDLADPGSETVAFTCPVCQKSFETEAKLKGHRMGAKH